MKNDIEKNHVSNASEMAEVGSTSLEETGSEQGSSTLSRKVASSQTVESRETTNVPIVLNLDESGEPDTARQSAKSTEPASAAVHIAPNLLPMVTGLSTTVEEQQAAKEQQDLNEIVHRMLIVGLVISTTLMLVGLGLDLALGHEAPTTASGFAEAIQRILALRPSGFLTLGLLVLIATPILRVVGSIGAFIYERDWRYALITFLVLIVVIISLVSGNG
jgi:uncharacterized membrane protein